MLAEGCGSPWRAYSEGSSRNPRPRQARPEMSSIPLRLGTSRSRLSLVWLFSSCHSRTAQPKLQCMSEQWNGYPYCAGVTNIALMKGAPGRALQTVRQLKDQVQAMRHAEEATRGLPWHQSFTVSRALDNAYFRPVIYALWGAFDVALTFVSPDLYLSNAPGPLTAQQIQRGLMLVSGTDEAQRSRALEMWTGGDPVKLVPYFVFVKLKVQPDWSGGMIAEAMAAAHGRLEEWRQAAPEAIRRQGTAVLGLGWSEILVLAEADTVACLCLLVSGLRSANRQDGRCVFAVSNSKLGYRHELVEAAIESLAASRTHTGEVPANLLADVTKSAASRFEHLSEAQSRPDIAVLRPSFAVPPGLERHLASRLSEALDALPQGLRGMVQYNPAAVLWQTGSHDMFGPALWFGRGLPDIQVTLFLRVLQAWLLADGRPEDSTSARRGLFISCDTSVRWETPHITGKDIDEPTTALFRPELVEALDQSFADLDLQTRQAAQILQLPYGRTEQLLNLIGTFRWAQQRPVVWEDSIALAPVVLCMVSYLQHIAKAWPLWLERCRAADTSVGDYFAAGEQLHDDLMRIGHEFQSSFYNRHLSGYLTDDVPDINLRYRGSIQQLLNISNMILDSMVEVVLGERACLTTVGETTSPAVHSRCTVIVANLQADTIRHPALLDTLGHEVGHQLVLDLIRLARGDFDLHAWTKGVDSIETLRAAAEAFQRIWDNLLFQDALGGKALEEGIADFVEWRLLGDSFDVWSQSVMLRALLVAAPIAAPDGTLPDDVPVPRTDILESVMIRLCIVQILDALVEAGDPPSDQWSWHERLLDYIIDQRLERVRHLLETTCFVGPSQSIADVVVKDWSEEIIRGRILGSASWLDSPEALGAVGGFVRKLAAHLQSRSDHPLWGKVREAMTRLRNATLGGALPALHVRHWIPWTAVQDEIRRSESLGSTFTAPKWVAIPQPLRHEGDSSAVRALVFQRGRVVYTTKLAAERARDADAEFIWNLLGLVPAWRLRLKDRIRSIAPEVPVPR